MLPEFDEGMYLLFEIYLVLTLCALAVSGQVMEFLMWGFW